MSDTGIRALPRHPAPIAPNILLGGEQTAGRFAVIEICERGGAAPPRHIHALEDEVVYVLTGRVTFVTDGEARVAGAGACVYLCRGGEHTYRVESDEARLLIFVAPAGLEGYYRELHQPPAEPGAMGEVERLVTLSARFGLTITGPGERVAPPPPARP